MENVWACLDTHTHMHSRPLSCSRRVSIQTRKEIWVNAHKTNLFILLQVFFFFYRMIIILSLSSPILPSSPLISLLTFSFSTSPSFPILTIPIPTAYVEKLGKEPDSCLMLKFLLPPLPLRRSRSDMSCSPACYTVLPPSIIVIIRFFYCHKLQQPWSFELLLLE